MGKIVALSLLLLAAAPGCSSSREPQPNVLLLVVDTLRADHTSLLGYERETTPRLDAFARSGLVFEHARASSSWTKPSMASLLTGLSAPAHGVESATARLSELATTLAEVLWSNGYRTALFSDNPYVSRPFGFAQGYEDVIDYASRSEGGGGALREHDARDWVRRSGAASLNAGFLAWLDGGDAARRWFAHIHYMEPHWPYRPPPAFHARFTPPGTGPQQLANLWELETGVAGAVAGDALPASGRQALVDAYDATIAFWDDRFGALIDELERRGQLDDTVIAVVSDHGEAFYEHATWAHQNSLYDELVRIPLVLRGPGIEPRRDSRHISAVDLPSTLLALVGLDAAAIGSGRSLLESSPSSWDGRLAHEGRQYHATIEQGRKWIVSQGAGLDVVEVFDLASDPAEALDRSGDADRRAEQMRDRLLERASRERAAGLETTAAEVSETMKDALRALGYAD
jgi:arylsulfatase